LPDISTIDVKVLKSECDDTNCTVESTIADDDSVGNATVASLELYEVFDDDIEYCFHGPKIVPWNETPATICTVNTIGAICSRQLFRILLDSGASCCLIKKSSLPQGVVLQDLSASKQIKTLSGQVMAQQVITLRDIRLPEFDKNR
jgi:hypothetical protein